MTANLSTTGKYLDALPVWARELSEKYYSRSYSLFVLYGNVRDLVSLRGQDSTMFVALDEFLFSALFGQRDLILHYDRGGLSFGNPASQADFRRALEGYDSFHGTTYAQSGVPRTPDAVLNLLDNYLRLRIADGKKIGLVIDFAETIAPAGDVSSMAAEDSNLLVILKRWARNAAFLNADVTICLVSENQIELNQGIVQNPGVSSIAIPLPDYAERLDFIRGQLKDKALPAGSEVSNETLATLGAGLKRMQLQSLISHAVQNQQPLTLKFLSERKRDLIESESGGLLEFVQSRFDLSFVAGNDQAKRKLQDAAAAIRAGNTDVLPMGYVICGPVGTGKTFITTCFAGEVGIPAVTLKNFRSMWQGVTEGNLERVLGLLKAMSPIAVIVDEADAQLGARSSSGDSGVGNRVFAQIAQFMGNTEYRGKVIWFLLTCRPDLLPVDLKRQGRAEEHIALFYPDTPEERLALLRAVQRKVGMKPFPPDVEKFFMERALSLSGADIEAVLVRSHMRSSLQKKTAVDADDLKAALDDFIPPYYPTEIDLQNMVAVLECTSKSLLPKQYRDLDRSEVIRRTNELMALARQSSGGGAGGRSLARRFSPNRYCPNYLFLNHDPIHPERPSCGREWRDRLGLDERRVVPPEGLRIALLTAAIEMQQISPVARAVIRKPLIGIGDATLVKQGQPETGSLAFVGHDRGNQRLIDGRLILPADLKCGRIHIPLHRVSEKMSQQKKSQLSGDRIVDVDFQSVEVAGERIRNISRDHANPVNLLQVLLHSRCVVCKRNRHDG